MDGLLNAMFITMVRKRLVNNEVSRCASYDLLVTDAQFFKLSKYDKLIKFNQCIVFVSLAMDVLVIGVMSYKK